MAAGQYPIRTRIAGDIVAEIVLPERQTGKVAILASGLPSTPSKGELLRFFADQGYVALLPRYRGTWESDGIFLDRSPAQDIRDIVDELVARRSIVDSFTGERVKIRVSAVHLFGFSFGGPAVLLNSELPIVKKIVAVSPVIDWKKKGRMNRLISMSVSSRLVSAERIGPGVRRIGGSSSRRIFIARYCG